AGSVNKKVYTSTTFDPGSSLSHFEDLCHPNYYPNNSYYVMSDGNYNTSLSGQFYSKRYLKEEERKVLCDLGYKVSNFFGSYPYPNTTQCGGNQIVGVNDGIIVNSGIITYQNVYIMGTGAQVISNFLTNDFNPNPSTLTFECPQSVFGLGSASQLNANQILYTPSASSNGGVDLIRYVPKDLNGNKGNITYIYVYLIKDGCTPSACSNMVNNGDFESSSGCYNLNNGSASKCWTNFRGSSDLFSLLGGCTGHPNYNLPTSLSNPPSPTWNNITTNKFFRGLYGGIDVNGVSMYEGMQNKLNSPLLPGETYVISFKAKMANTNPYYNKTKLVIAGSNGPVFSSTGSLNPLPNLLNEIKVVEIPFNNSWNAYNFVFSVENNSLPLNNIQIINGFYLVNLSNDIHSYVYLDDFSIKNINDYLFFTPLTTNCDNSQYDLNNSVNIPNGVFSGNGIVNVHFFDPVSAGVGTHIITYTIDGCTSTSATIEVGATIVTPLFTQIQPICFGELWNTPLPTTSLNGIS
ncbi:MAG: hypothetical protein EBU01_09805, partial [Crocinitomicaceae bacterium]|nr:hypothetical protein [Crocinitomicaceae bacterium]